MASTTSNDLVQLSIGTIRFGETLRDDAGNETLASADAVVLSTLVNGDIRHSVQLEPESAMTVATALAQAGGKLMADQVDDTGKRVGLLGYIRSMRSVSTKTPPTPPPGNHNHPDTATVRQPGSACQACETYWASQGVRP